MPVEKSTENGLEVLTLALPEHGMSCKVLPFGAHVTSWKVAGAERLFMSKTAVLDGSKGIRGGIPVVFPQFGPGKLPQHGFARTSTWKVEGTNVDRGDHVEVQLGLGPEQVAPAMQALWSHAFRLTYIVSLHADRRLVCRLVVRNPFSGAKAESLSFTALLHPYFAVPDVTKLTVSSLRGRRYFDKVVAAANAASGAADPVEGVEDRDAVTFPGEVDRIFRGVGASAALELRESGAPVLTVRNVPPGPSGTDAPLGFADVVVWNPSPSRAGTMSDLHDGGWREFVCVELGSVSEPVILGPGETWEGIQELVV